MGNSSARGREHPGLVLDRVASQPDAENAFPLYRLANYRKSGELIEAYTHGGLKEAEKFVDNRLRLFMYNDGRGKTVSVEDCKKWKHHHNGEVCLQIEPTEDSGAPEKPQPNAPTDPTDPSTGNSNGGTDGSREVCWSLEYRGALGETLLHVLIMCDSRPHLRLAKLLLKYYPCLAKDMVEGQEFYGVTALHLAIAYGNDDLAKQIITCGANILQRATGIFFFPTDQQVIRTNETNYAGLAYFGEYPLVWAACFENEGIYNYLVSQGAHPNMADTFGNMVLHVLVINDKLSMYGYALRHPKIPARNDLTNSAGLTPLTLACTLGRNEIFREMLELSSVEFWRYSSITCSAYPLNALDTILPDGKTNWKSALMIILRGSSDQHLDMLEGGVVQRLLEDKWKTYARRQFLKHLVILFQHLVTLSIAVFLRPNCASFTEPDCESAPGVTNPLDCNEDLYSDTDPKSIIRYCTEIASIISSGNYVIIQQGQEIWTQGIIAYFKGVMRSPVKLIFLIANLLILSCIPCRFLHLRQVEDVFLSLALPGSWFFLIFFAGAVRLTGPFVTMIYNMIAGDMVRFGIIYLIMLLGFSQAFYFLFKNHSGELEKGDEYESYMGVWMALFHMTLGAYEYNNFEKTSYNILTRVVFVVFMIIVPILLLNMLIAMMGNTYIQVINKSEKEFVKQWANIVLTLERSMNQKTAGGFLDTYAINLKPATATEDQIKGLMVIKSKNISKAKQRNRALFNWKRTRLAIKAKLAKYNCHGEDLLDVIKAEGAPKGNWEEEAEVTPGAERKNLGFTVTQLISAAGLDLSAQLIAPVGCANTQPKTPDETTIQSNTNNQQHDIDHGQDNVGFVYDENDVPVVDTMQKVDAGLAMATEVRSAKKKRRRVKHKKTSKVSDCSNLPETTTLLEPEEAETNKRPKSKKKKRKKSMTRQRNHEDLDDSRPIESLQNDVHTVNNSLSGFIGVNGIANINDITRITAETDTATSVSPSPRSLPEKANKRWAPASVVPMTTLLEDTIDST